MLYQPHPRTPPAQFGRRVLTRVAGVIGALLSAAAQSGADRRILDRMTPQQLDELGLYRPEPGRYDRYL